jgi:anti-anti-sigma factor
MTDNSAACRVAIAGEFSIFTAAAVREQLLAALGAADEVEVDLSQVSEIDSAGIQLMVAAKREAAAHNRSVRFTCPSGAVSEILELCDLAGLLGDPVPIDGLEAIRRLP